MLFVASSLNSLGRCTMVRRLHHHTTTHQKHDWSVTRVPPVPPQVQRLGRTATPACLGFMPNRAANTFIYYGNLMLPHAMCSIVVNSSSLVLTLITLSHRSSQTAPSLSPRSSTLRCLPGDSSTCLSAHWCVQWCHYPRVRRRVLCWPWQCPLAVHSCVHGPAPLLSVTVLLAEFSAFRVVRVNISTRR